MSKARVSQTTVPSNRKNKVIASSQRNKSSSSSIAPRGEPWNHKQFLKRVQTFNSIKWHIKRNDVHPLLCARFGWKCVNQNTLQCTECGTKINYKTNALWNIDTNNKVAAAFLHNISFAHNPQCIWKKNPSHESFEYLPTDNCMMKQQLIENISSWTHTDTHSFYLMTKLEPNAKQVMMRTIGDLTANAMNKWCIDILFMSVSGWKLTGLMNGNDSRYIECQYCNKCISFQCYDYHKTLSLFTENERLPQHKDENQRNVCNILTQQLPIHDTESVIHRLSALGLKIDTNVRRTHNFYIYETKTLQKQAHFNNNDANEESKSNSLSLSTSIASTPSFGSFRSRIQSTFGGSMTNMRWPKQSILTQTNSLSKSQKTSRKKRNRNEITSDVYEMDEEQLCPRKKVKKHTNNINYAEINNTENENVNLPTKKRKNLKRKMMESDTEQSVSADFERPNVKKRKINPMEASSTNNKPTKRKRNRKRKFVDAFENEEIKDNDEDEDDDIECGIERDLKLSKPSTKRARVQKPYFDPINLHNDHCPFRRKYKYHKQQQDDICGWEYCLYLLAKDNIDIVCIIKQIIADQSK